MIKHKGLNQSQVQARQNRYGLNEIQEQSRLTLLDIFLNQFNNFLVYLLLFAAALSFFLGEYLDGGFILFVIIVNAIFGFIQEYKAENALQALKKMAVSNVRVIRDEKEELIDSRYLVPGDIIKLSEGDRIPADAELIESLHLEINEASISGESLPVAKSVYDKNNNSLYLGTIVTSGKAIAFVSAIGKETKFGKMASSLSQIADEETPLAKKINKLSKKLSLLAIIITGSLFAIGLFLKQSFVETVLTSISLAVAAVPEGLPAVITITLAIGLQRMAKKKAILRKLSAIEALGNTTVIVSDKTGTLTENKMRITSLWLENQEFTINGEASKYLTNSTFFTLLKTGIICNNAALLHTEEKKQPEIIGDQTEGSLLLLSHDLGVEPEKIREQGKIIDEFTFDSTKKMMSVLRNEDQKNTLFVKGAPEAILNLSSYILSQSKASPLSAKQKKQISAKINGFASKGLRVLALAYKEIKKIENKRELMEVDLVFVGFVGISDPPRKEAAATLEMAKEAGIRTIMVTGDNPLTAANIGKSIALISKNGEVISGTQLKKMTNEELNQKLRTINIFARAVPEDKLRIVKILQQQNNIVAVTGDGVNDALALKQANVGIAMGITGTDVAKEVSDMIITDDNFASIVEAIKEGRIIFTNIVKSITYLVSCNFGEILTIAATLIISLTANLIRGTSQALLPMPLLPIHILWINLVTDGLPAISLAFDPGSDLVMRQKQHRTELLNKDNYRFMLFFGSLIAIITVFLFILSLQIFPLTIARTVAFNSLVILQMVMVFLVRKNQPFFSNPLLIFSVVVSLLLQVVIFTVPPFPTIFKLR